MTAYQILVFLREDITLKVGGLGIRDFKKGYYIYSGSAKRGIQKRVARHYSKDKKVFWHFDYLTLHPSVEILEHRLSDASECALNQTTSGINISRFGSSDCSTCQGHLRFQPSSPSFSSLISE